MAKEIEEALQWSVAASARLRLVQASCAELTPDQRRLHVSIEVEHLLQEVPAEKRQRYVQALKNRFPTGEGVPPAPCAASTASDLASPFVGPPETPEDLLEKLLASVRNLPPERRQKLADRLAAAGWAPPAATTSNAVRMDAARESELALSTDVLKAKLDLPPDRPLDLLRTVRLLSVVLDVFEKLDHMVWSIWKRLAPHSRLQPSNFAGKASFRDKVAAFLDGQAADSPEHLASSIDHSTRMAIALLNGLGLGGRNFAKKHLARIAPENIALEARREGGSIMQSLEHRSWQRYEHLCRDLTADALETELRETIAQAAEALYQSN